MSCLRDGYYSAVRKREGMQGVVKFILYPISTRDIRFHLFYFDPPFTSCKILCVCSIYYAGSLIKVLG